ncbi:hypothetical protein A3A20_01600 [Candidatus Wolfebacteria bacterium RIFCSPLOWO2_01_FULL_45_19]|uniref:Large ribosomal subunit protein uL15 n=1 Tax=Candidatus Wolfebacteria bacterium RIFCSPLOWO2_01_FULL_45_19 TaxID=1802557 RepID=A0A1F8DT83_9BACT|nr:MAG: 50S ribosomal protein L15 [Parcubacteria group bacterium GW2011_GWB1_45_9]OGM91616.1 MAG: hypothetical protein A3A20_01600 [Candidatus Wolfebacteria bacterium RIFCSPLOWO2_01_FULL_45_19]
MQLHQLRTSHKQKTKKRIGRGGKRGTYSGRGQKGQKARAGRRIRPAIQDYIIRLPKRRGFGNKPLGSKTQIVNLSSLERKLENNSSVSEMSLLEAGLIKKLGKTKILGDGNVTKSFIIEKNIAVSKSAKEKIEAAGGRINHV